MKVNDTQLTLKSNRKRQFPKRRLPEIAFAGRSNVGKSSLINSLLHRHKLVPTSRTPGRTRSVDFYLVNDSFYFVDLPGYGYASVAKSRRDYWRDLIAAYIADNPNLRLACVLLDPRRTPSELDLELAGMLEECRVPTALVATKSDKVGKSQQRKACIGITREFGLGDDMDALALHSAKTGRGNRDLWRIIEEVLGQT